jgi:hypothetical protein
MSCLDPEHLLAAIWRQKSTTSGSLHSECPQQSASKAEQLAEHRRASCRYPERFNQLARGTPSTFSVQPKDQQRWPVFRALEASASRHLCRCTPTLIMTRQSRQQLPCQCSQPSKSRLSQVRYIMTAGSSCPLEPPQSHPLLVASAVWVARHPPPLCNHTQGGARRCASSCPSCRCPGRQPWPWLGNNRAWPRPWARCCPMQRQGRARRPPGCCGCRHAPCWQSAWRPMRPLCSPTIRCLQNTALLCLSVLALMPASIGGPLAYTDWQMHCY